MTASSFPFTLTPHLGESFDSWLETYAARLQVSISDLGAAFGLPALAAGAAIRVLLTGAVTDAHRNRISYATGVDLSVLDGMFHRPGTSSRPIADTPSNMAVRHAFVPTTGSRFCPDCLADNGDRFPLAWRLSWSFFCLHHDRLLASTCPECHRPPRVRLAISNLRQPGRCRTRLRRDGPGQPVTSCGADLTATPPGPIEPTRARAAQLIINDQLQLINGHDADSVEHQRAADNLTDLSAITWHLSRCRVTAGASGDHPDTVRANAFISAVDLLGAVDTHPDPLTGLVHRPGSAARLPAVPHSWRMASPNLRARIAHRRDDRLSSTERLRHATTLRAPAPPPRPGSVDPARSRADHLPDQLWPSWALRLIDDDRADHAAFRRAAVVALLIPHSDLTLDQIASLAGGHLSGEAVETHMTILAKTRNGRTALRIITELALALDQHPVPIDYRRRRQLAATTDLIDMTSWRQLTRRCHHVSGANRRLRYARRYLYEVLTAGSLSIAPAPYTLRAPARDDYHDFVFGLPASLVDALAEHAISLLTHAGITDEPLQWQPPTSWVTVTAWPGTEPDQTDPAPLHEALQQGHPVGLIARNHGISTEHLRYLIRRHPVPGRSSRMPRSGTLVPLHTTTERIANALYVDLGWLREQYLTRHRSLADLAAEIGSSLTNLARFAKQQGIPLRPPGGGADYLGDIPVAARTDLPGLLRDALRGHHGRQRVERFLLLAQTNNQSRAAEQLGITPSVLTEQLALLEQRCGGPLFNRRPRRISHITPLGEQLRQQAQLHLGRPLQEAAQA
jgi:hypothetical protein